MIRSILTWDPRKRITMSQIFNHVWLTGEATKVSSLSHLKTFIFPFIQSLCISVGEWVVKNLRYATSNQVRLFKTNSSSTLDLKNLRQMLGYKGMRISQF